MTSDSASGRIEALETALAHAEAALEDLSDMVRAQGEEIDALRRELGRLSRALQAALEDQGDASPADQRPPHY